MADAMKASRSGAPASGQVDFDLHGLAGIRLLDASAHDVAAVVRQLGPIQAALSREPDIVVRFVDRLPITSELTYLGLDEAGFTDDAFLVLRSKFNSRAMVKIDFERIGDQCEIVCERGLAAVPLLIPILNLTVLENGALPLHAAAFTYSGTGFLATGWSKGGKTETLLAFMKHGASYVGDEWVYLTPDGLKMYGIPEPIRVWDWHLDFLPEHRQKINAQDRLRLGMFKTLATLLERAPFTQLGPGSLVSRLIPVLKRQLFVDLRPERLFGARACALMGAPQKVLFMASFDQPDTRIRPMEPAEVAHRMVFSLQHERLDLMAYYLKFRFAFPDRANPRLERAEERQREILTRALAGKETYAVLHPYPVPLDSLFEAINPLCGERI